MMMKATYLDIGLSLDVDLKLSLLRRSVGHAKRVGLSLDQLGRTSTSRSDASKRERGLRAY